MKILPCIDKSSTNWKKLVEQTNEQLAKDTYATKKGMPAIVEPEEILNFIGLQNEAFVKPGVSELFESNPELANFVYKALGFGEFDKTYNYKKDILNKFNADVETIVNGMRNVSIASDEEPYLELELEIAKENNIKYFTYKLENNGRITNEYIFYNDKGKEQAEEILNIFKNLYGTKQFQAQLGYLLQYDLDEVSKFTGIDKSKIKKLITKEQKQQAQQLYSQYLDTIFPDSKVKDIVYHGTKTKYKMTEGMNPFEFAKLKDTLRDKLINKEITQEKYNEEFDKLSNVKVSKQIELPSFDKFDKTFIGKGQGLRSDDMAKGFYFGSYKIADRVGTRIIPAVLNVEEENSTTVRKNTVDFDTKGDVFVVFEPEQIHILGSNQDIKGFKEFVNNKPNLKKDTAKRLRLYNELNNSSHSLQILSNEEFKLNINYLAISSELTRQKTRENRVDQDVYDFNKPVLGIHEKLNNKELQVYKDISKSVENKISNISKYYKKINDLKFSLPINSIDSKNNLLENVQDTYDWGLKVKTFIDKLYNNFGEVIKLNKSEDSKSTVLTVTPSQQLINFLLENSETNEEDYTEIVNLKKELSKKAISYDVDKIKINKSISYEVENLFANRFKNLSIISSYFNSNNIESITNKEQKDLSAFTFQNEIILNRESAGLKAPIKNYVGEIIMHYLLKNDISLYKNIQDFIKSLPLYNKFKSQFYILNNEETSNLVFSNLIKLGESNSLNEEDENYYNTVKSFLIQNKPNILNEIFNKLFNSNLEVNFNTSLEDIVIKLSNNEEFLKAANYELDLKKEEMFKNISNRDIIKHLEDKNYIQQICKI
jgi:hypothetical protein